MKIKMNGKEITVSVVATSSTPMGGNYWSVAYTLDGASLATVHTGPCHNPPEPLELLNVERESSTYDYDTPDAETHTGMDWKGEPITWKNGDKYAGGGTCNSRPCAWYRSRYTIREKLLWAISQIVED